MMGFECGAGKLADRLGPAMRWCDRNRLPALTAIVVKKTTGIPGAGWQTVGDAGLQPNNRKVFNTTVQHIPPELSELI